MAKFYGIVGYVDRVEGSKPGVWMDEVTERYYYGDVTRNTARFQTVSDKLNDDITISNEISIIADQFAYNYAYAIRYVEYLGSKWQVTNVEILHPRLNLTIGGVYNG